MNQHTCMKEIKEHCISFSCYDLYLDIHCKRLSIVCNKISILKQRILWPDSLPSFDVPAVVGIL